MLRTLQQILTAHIYTHTYLISEESIEIKIRRFITKYNSMNMTNQVKHYGVKPFIRLNPHKRTPQNYEQNNKIFYPTE